MYFIKRNWKNLLVFGLCAVCIILWICSFRAGSVEETKRISRDVAGLEDPANLDSTGDSDGPGVASGPAGSVEDGSNSGSSDQIGSDINSDNQNNPDNSAADSPDKTNTNSNKTNNNSNKNKSKKSSSDRKTSDGKRKTKDKYNTDPVPKGKPEPVNPEDQKKTKDWFYVYLSIDCETILDHMDDLSEGLEKYVGDGTILKKTKVKCYKGESVWDVLSRECKARGINLESEYTAVYGSAYVEAINNLGEFDCGELSGWCFSVNDWFPNYGCSRYILKKSEWIRWRYTCDLGRDLGITWN